MKTLIAALALSTLSLPAAAMDASMPLPFQGLSAEILLPGMDEYGRRSGRCPSGGARSVFREGSTCGGI